MSSSRLTSFSWTDKPELKKSLLYILGFLAASVFVFVRLKPYFANEEIIKTFNREKEDRPSKEQNKNEDKDLSSPAQKGLSWGRKDGSGISNSSQMSHIIERPLFDGLTVKLTAVLTQKISSSQNELNVEAELSENNDSSIDSSFLQGAKLMGVATPNFDTKHMEIRFSELLVSNGRHYNVIGYAIDEATQSIGVAAQYSSGTFSRIAGATLGRAISVGEDILTQKAFKATGTDSNESDQLNRALLDTSHQASGDLSDEATKDLRNTKQELYLPIGTTFKLKLRASNQAKGK